MWNKTIKIKYKSHTVEVMIWLSDSGADGTETVSIQSMFNQFFIIDTIKFNNRDAAYDFIKTANNEFAKAFFMREGYSSGALQD